MVGLGSRHFLKDIAIFSGKFSELEVIVRFFIFLCGYRRKKNNTSLCIFCLLYIHEIYIIIPFFINSPYKDHKIMSIY